THSYVLQHTTQQIEANLIIKHQDLDDSARARPNETELSLYLRRRALLSIHTSSFSLSVRQPAIGSSDWLGHFRVSIFALDSAGGGDGGVAGDSCAFA